MKKIVIISRTIYPSINPRSHRATELAKEFSRKGHSVILYGEKGDNDYHEFENKYNLKVKDIGPLLFSSKLKKNFFIKVIGAIIERTIGRLIEFPDIELVDRVKKILSNEKDIDLLITIAVPHSIHWGASSYKKQNPSSFARTWIADCGDPYKKNSYLKTYPWLEKNENIFCKECDFITVPIESAVSSYGKEFKNKIVTIPQGFAIPKSTNLKDYKKNDIVTFAYAGSFYEKLRDPRPFLRFLKYFDRDYRFILYIQNTGFASDEIKALGDKVVVNSFIDRDSLIHRFSLYDFLINFENVSKNQSPSKLIDYAVSGRPVYSIPYNEKDFFDFFRFYDGDYNNALKLPNISEHDIKIVADKFLQLAKND